MPTLRTDDGPRRLRAVWLGPKGATLPFEWTYVQWMVVIVAASLVGDVAAVVAWFVTHHDLTYTAASAVIWGWPLGGFLAVRSMRGVSFDEPLRAKLATIRSQLGNRKEKTTVPAVGMWEITFPPIHHLAEPTLQCLRWSEHGQRPHRRPEGEQSS